MELVPISRPPTTLLALNRLAMKDIKQPGHSLSPSALLVARGCGSHAVNARENRSWQPFLNLQDLKLFNFDVTRRW